MISSFKVKQSLSDRVANELIHMITSGSFSSNKLPAEPQLAKSFGVSLPVLRQALLLLREKGVVTKKHGSGNYFHRGAIEAGIRLDRFEGFHEMLVSLGYEVRDTVLSVQPVQLQQKYIDALKLSPEDEVLLYKRLIYANGVPSVYSENYLPMKYFVKPLDECFQTGIGMYDVMTQYFGKEPAYGVMELIPHLTTKEEKKQICAAPGQPIIIMGEAYYSLEDIPVAYGVNKFNHDHVPIYMLSR